MNSDVLGVGLQNNWQWCKKCQALAFAGNASLGDCPAGGLHDHTGSRNYSIAMNTPVPPGSQGNWRWCNKCQALTFAGSASLGKCSGGGNHDHAGSGNYVLPIRAGNAAVPLDYQDNFRWCNKCQVLSWRCIVARPCQAGGEHVTPAAVTNAWLRRRRRHRAMRRIRGAEANYILIKSLGRPRVPVVTARNSMPGFIEVLDALE